MQVYTEIYHYDAGTSMGNSYGDYDGDFVGWLVGGPKDQVKSERL